MQTNKMVAPVAAPPRPPQRRPGAKKDKWVRHEMMKVVNELYEWPEIEDEDKRKKAPKIKKLRRMVLALAERACQGDVEAFREFANRLDGKVADRALTLDETPSFQFQVVLVQPGEAPEVVVNGRVADPE